MEEKGHIEIIDNIELLEDYGIYIDGEFDFVAPNIMILYAELIMPDYRLN